MEGDMEGAPMDKPARMPSRAKDVPMPTLPEPGLLLVGPLTAMRMWADMNRAVSSAMPASLLIAASPFFWAPPLWVGALMAAHSHRERRRAGES